MNEDYIKWGLGIVIEGSAGLIYILFGPHFVSVLLVIVGIIIIGWGIFGSKSKSEEEKKLQGEEQYKEEESKLVEETLFDGHINVPKGDHKKLKYKLKKGDIITGIVSETVGDPFNFFIMDEDLYSKYRGEHDPEYFDGDEDIKAYTINFSVPHDGRWYFVFDTFMKRIRREIEVDLRRSFYKK